MIKTSKCMLDLEVLDVKRLQPKKILDPTMFNTTIVKNIAICICILQESIATWTTFQHLNR